MKNITELSMDLQILYIKSIHNMVMGIHGIPVDIKQLNITQMLIPNIKSINDTVQLLNICEKNFIGNFVMYFSILYWQKYFLF